MTRSTISHRLTGRSARVTALSLAALAVIGPTVGTWQQASADAGQSASDGSHLTASTDNSTAAEALAELNGISVADAKQQLREEHKLDTLSDRLGKKLGEDMAGSYLDGSGDLVIQVTSKKAARGLTSAPIDTEVVSHSATDLAKVIDHLNRYSQNHDTGTITGWYEDIAGNRVVVERSSGAIDQGAAKLLKLARTEGNIVEVETTTATPTSTDALWGGQKVVPGSGTCSIAFNAVDANGRNVFLTAGHCAVGYPTFSRNGYVIGGTRSYSFPNNDFAVVNNNYPGYWTPKAGMDRYNGYATLVYGYSSAPVGSSLCKSGATTGWTCGTITAYNRTVSYSQGAVYGLVQHNACVEPGDSGGANMSGNYAQGITSGANLVDKRYCGARYGSANVSFYQPIGEALSAYNLRLLVIR